MVNEVRRAATPVGSKGRYQGGRNARSRQGKFTVCREGVQKGALVCLG